MRLYVSSKNQLMSQASLGFSFKTLKYPLAYKSPFLLSPRLRGGLFFGPIFCSYCPFYHYEPHWEHSRLLGDLE